MPRFDVTIAGELNMDLILYGLPDEIPPEREILGSGMQFTLGGSSSIAAHNLASLGNRVGFISCVGRDSLGDLSLSRLAEGGDHAAGDQHGVGRELRGGLQPAAPASTYKLLAAPLL